MEHTPLPWETLGSAQVVAPDNKSMICEMSEPRDYEGYPTAMHVRPKIWNPHFKEACANAEYIVKCVNSHEKLVEACKELLEWMGAKYPLPGEQAKERARAALKEPC